MKIRRDIMRFVFTQSKKGWFKTHINDPFVKKAQDQNLRSRAAFKLQQIQEKYKVLGERTLDLGSAPGSWSQMTARLHPSTKIIAVDLLQMEQLEGVDYYRSDARSPLLHQTLLEKYSKFDSIISDMAPNFTGVGQQSHFQIIELNKLCLGLAGKLGVNKCNLVMKSLNGVLDKPFFTLLGLTFEKVHRFKPHSSRKQSSQFYYICKSRKQMSENDIKVIQDLYIRERMEKKDFIEILSK